MSSLSVLFGLIMLVMSSVTYSYTVMVPEDVLKDYQQFLAGRDVHSIRDFRGPFSRRDVVELVLFQQAMALGGVKAPVKFLPSPETSFTRIGQLIKSGRTSALALSVWRQELSGFEDQVRIVDSLIENGDFEAGFYARPEHIDRLSRLSEADFRRQSMVSSQNWVVDWRTLEDLGFIELHHQNAFEDMVASLTTNEAHMTLAPFSNRDDLSLQTTQGQLAVVPGKKVVLQGTRHWVTSRRNPMGELMFIALQRGLQTLQQSGLVRQAYQQSGFFNAKTQHWTLMQPMRVEPNPEGSELRVHTLYAPEPQAIDVSEPSSELPISVRQPGLVGGN